MITNEALLAGLEKAFLSDRPHYKLGSRDYQYYAHDLADIAPAFRCEDLGAMLRRQFGKGKGSELKPKDNAPPKMHAVHSSSAQCVNAFALPAFFLGRDSGFWSKFFGQDVWDGFDEWSFEAQYPISVFGKKGCSLKGTPPHLDFEIGNKTSGNIIAVESKLAEIYHDDHDYTIRSSYFSQSILRAYPKLWNLALKIHTGDELFCHLDAAQLIKHSLGLLSTGKQFKLGYFYNALASCEKHELEVFRFKDLLADAGVDFFATTYQDAFHRIEGYRCDLPFYADWKAWFEKHYFL